PAHPPPPRPVRLLLALALLAAVPATAAPPDTLSARYVQKDEAALTRMRAAARSTSEDLLLRYRLYPLTGDARLLRDLPGTEACEGARDYALLSALWGFRISEAPPWKVPTYGRRSSALLERARALDPDDPYVLLVEGQSLLFRPALFGGDPEAALDRFERLGAVLRERPVPGMEPLEAEVWRWTTLRRLGRPEAEALRQRLLAQDPPPLFRDFLLSPPDR
ncbi:MAG: hypothetical protein R3362_11765, partial [Rhodothermales bacterium]|nr:hypothetical protein [Rhodothermales bacterium]